MAGPRVSVADFGAAWAAVQLHAGNAAVGSVLLQGRECEAYAKVASMRF